MRLSGLSAAVAFVAATGLVLVSLSMNEALAQDIDESEYQSGLMSREEYLQESSDNLGTAKDGLATTEASLLEAIEKLSVAETAFGEAEFSGDSDAIGAAWAEVTSALAGLDVLIETHDLHLGELEQAENNWEKYSIWLEQYKNDYEAQSDLFSVRDGITQCGTAFCSSASFLNDERFNVFQPNVLEMVGVHYAYAKGLTGKGVRIGIEDDIVNYSLPEFAGRISFEGASLTYPVFDGDEFLSDPQLCERESILAPPGCAIFPYSTIYKAVETLTVRWIIAVLGWPDENQNWFIRNDAYEEGDLRRWVRIPNRSSLSHGTHVASVAAGRDFGVAPGATLIPIATDFSLEGQSDQYTVESSILQYIRDLPDQDRRLVDSILALGIEADYAQYDVVNRSFGIGVFDSASVSAALNDETQWWGEGLRKILPEFWRAYMQTGTHPDDRTIVVYAAGNEFEEWSGLGAEIPYWEPHVRGSQLSVMAVDHSGSHANYTNFCGPLPYDWDTERWGRHFCLAAPGTVNAADGGGRGFIAHEIQGTSFAAPVVTGAIALLMEHFRGQLGNTEIVKRVVNTANNEGRYAQLEIYGAGLLDLEAALRPVGRTVTGTSSLYRDTLFSVISAPPAMGNIGLRLAGSGVEVASLDSLGAPFWSSPEQFVHTVWHPTSAITAFAKSPDACCAVDWHNPSVEIPAFASPENFGGRDTHLGFTPGTIAGPVNENGLRLLVGKDRIGFEQAPVDGFRWGVLADAESWQGGRASGAFGDQVRSMSAWVGRSAQVELAQAWTLNASATLALGRPFFQSGVMLDVGTHAMSAWDIGVERGERGRGTWSRLSLSQPLRAELGKGTFTYLSGLKDGERVYDHANFSLAPGGREVELALTHEAQIGWGRGVIQVAHAWDARHEPGRNRSRIGAAYRVSW